MQLEQQETFRIEGPQLEVFGQAESKLPAPAKKRPAAALALVVLALVSVLGIGGAKLNTKYNQVRAIYSASNEHGQSMENDLSLRADAAANLIRLCGQVLGEDAPSVQAAQQALDDWNATDADHPADQFAANTALGSAVDIMYNEVVDAGKSTGSIEAQHTEFLSRQDIILRTAGNDYNPAAEEYNKTLSAFPANVVGALWGIGEVEAFQ
ncbi:hypothetical protein [uncultured Gemmiger sp.]|uniref:hypothetical protein n=1 Tax=uncultured Gemmiger sp. TaxID=1623490 RepID=UPI0025D3A035|nr:hypothetical protein [uncultured Gemmiger sp.]